MKPSLKRFEEVAMRCGGNISAMAAVLGVNRRTVYDWTEADRKFKAIITEHRGRLLDKCLKTAELLANGVPRVETTEDGAKEFAGWKVQPDSNMLRYLIGRLGANEGFGESIDVTSKGESIKPEPYVIRVISEIKEDLTKEPKEIIPFDKE